MSKTVRATGIEPEYVTLTEWFALSHLSRTTTYRLLAAKRLRAVKVGRRVLIDLKIGREFLDSLPAIEVAPEPNRSLAA